VAQAIENMEQIRNRAIDGHATIRLIASTAMFKKSRTRSRGEHKIEKWAGFDEQ
jgi:hypothetical protein